MQLTTRSYQSKVLLFGEYTVLHGSRALAMPCGIFGGKWILDRNHNSRRHLEPLKQYLLMRYHSGDLQDVDFDEMERLSANGLAFESNIPQGYGLGSSGAVSAAVYDLFKKKTDQIELRDLKQDLAVIESSFHGSSSGVDPLVSYLNQPVLIHTKDQIELIDGINKSINKRLYLIDTELPRSTAPLVQAYLETRRSSEQFLMEMQEIAEINDALIEAYLQSDVGAFERLITQLSACQYRTMRMLIPQRFHSLWQEGLASGNYVMKLNGAGGGGYLMMYRKDAVEYTEGIALR